VTLFRFSTCALSLRAVVPAALKATNVEKHFQSGLHNCQCYAANTVLEINGQVYLF
jgi:hypothetical protein